MRVDRGDPRNVAAGHVAFNHDAFWDDKEAQKLSHTSVRHNVFAEKKV